MKRIILLPLIILLFSQTKKEEAIYLNKIDPKLLQKLEKMADNEKIKIYIDLPNVDYSYVATLPTGDEKTEYMKNYAYTTQEPIVNYLKSKLGEIEGLYQGWTANRIFATLPKYIIFELVKKFPEIVMIHEDEYRIWIPQNYTPHILSDFYPGEDYVSGSIQNIKADEAWRRGYKGKGIVVGNMDTGVDGNHPVLRNSFRGIYAWYDAIANSTTTPVHDSNGHGTGTMGFIVGSHGIGAAPGAKWIAVKILNAQGGGTTLNIQRGFDWVANLADSLKPHIMSNSWGSDNTTDQTFWPNIQAWLVRGIIPVFAAGNAGPNASTAGTPGNFPMVFGIGGTWWPSEEIIWYSSRGPAPNQTPWTNTAWWGRPDWNRHKPDLIAPSEPTVTAAPGGEYQDFGGTSAATPHAAGCLALLLQANSFGLVPGMAGMDTSEIRKIFKFVTGYGYGDANSYWNPAWGNPQNIPNLRDTFGWGRVDAEKWIANAPEPTVPNIFIDSVWVVSTTDGDKEIEPGENSVTIAIRLKNTGAYAANVTGRIMYRTNSNITPPLAAQNYGNLQRGQSATQNFTLRTSTGLPQNTRIYFTFRINSTTGNYIKRDFFYLDTWKQNEPSQTRSLRYDNGTAYYYPGNDPQYQNYRYFASRFETVNTGTMVSCSVYTYNGSNTAVTCTLFVWDHNSTYNSPGNLIAWRTISVGTAEQWYNFDITDIPGIPAGYIWVGLRKNGTTNNGVPYQDSDRALTTNKSTNTRNNPSSWTLESWWYDFMIRPRITYDPIVAPSIFYEGSNIFDDSRYGNGDGWTDPGEQGGLAISLKNLGLNAYNVTGTLQAADPFTTQYVTIIKNTASFGNAPNGNPSTNNYNDPWIIRISDDCPITGDQDFNFIVNISAQYYPAGSGTPSNYTKTINFTLSSPFVPEENTWWWVPSGVGDLYYYPMNANRYYHTDFYFGLKMPEDSFIIDTVAFFLYNNGNAQRTATLRIRRAADPPSFAPTTTDYWSGTQNVAGNTYGWYFLRPNVKVPAWVWWHEYLLAGAAGGLQPIFWGSPFIGSIMLVDATDGAPWGDVGYIALPLAFYFKMRWTHATLSYYRPSTWSWPITPTNTRNSTTIPSTLSSWPDTTFVNFAIYNRSNSDIAAPPSNTARGARGVWDNYLFLDNWGQWNAQVNVALNAWNYLTAQNLWLKVPGGRHTLLIGLDWNNEVGGNVLNEYMRYWGQQFSWTPRYLENTVPLKLTWIPELTGPFAGPYYNATVYACSTRLFRLDIPQYGKPWHGVAIRNFNQTWDNDLDLRLYTDAPSDPYSGYTNVIEASELGPGMVDYIMIDGHHVGTKYYAGVYSFLEPANTRPDSGIIHFEAARAYITTGATYSSITSDFTDLSVINVYDVIINNGQTFVCTLRVLSGTQTYEIALFRSTPTDRIKRRSDYLVRASAAPGSRGYISYTNSGANDTFGLAVIGNLNASGSYILKFTGTVSLGEMEIEFSGKSTEYGIELSWSNIEKSKEIYIEKDAGKGFLRIAKLTPDSRNYLDRDVEDGKTYKYRLIINNHDNTEKTLGPISVTYNSPLPKELTIISIKNLNPKRGSIKVAIPRKEKIDIELFNSTGRIVKKIYSGYIERGIYEFNIEVKTKGVYFLVVKDNKKKIKEKIIFM